MHSSHLMCSPSSDFPQCYRERVSIICTFQLIQFIHSALNHPKYVWLFTAQSYLPFPLPDLAFRRQNMLYGLHSMQNHMFPATIGETTETQSMAAGTGMFANSDKVGEGQNEEYGRAGPCDGGGRWWYPAWATNVGCNTLL